MTKKYITGREHELLKLMFRYTSENNDLPSSSWLREEIGLSSSHVSNLLRSLLKKGFIKKFSGMYALTDKAQNYLTRIGDAASEITQGGVLPAKVWVRGQVKAGKSKTDELIVDLFETYQPGNKVIDVPNVKSDRKIYALEIVGVSMEQEFIRDGDFVIVEEFRLWEKPNEGELIVAKYLPISVATDDFVRDISDNDFWGPTLKFYFEREEDGQKVILLGAKKNNLQYPHLIKASEVRPIGRAIGIYREI